MNRYRAGWYNDNHRHYLAAKYGSAGKSKMSQSPHFKLPTHGFEMPTPHASADSGAIGKAFLLGSGSKFNLASDARAGANVTVKDEAMGEVAMMQDEASGEESFDLGIDFGWDITPDVKTGAADAEDNFMANGFDVTDRWFKMGKGEEHVEHQSTEHHAGPWTPITTESGEPMTSADHKAWAVMNAETGEVKNSEPQFK